MSKTSLTPLRSPPGQTDLVDSLVAPGQVDQVEGTLKDFRDQLLNQRESLSLIPAMEEKVLAIDCTLHELELYVGKPRIPVLEQFQRWLETKAHKSSAVIQATEPRHCFASDVYLDESLVIAECRVATKLLMQFKLEQGK